MEINREKITAIFNKVLPLDKCHHLIIGLHLFIGALAVNLTGYVSVNIYEAFTFTACVGFLIEIHQKLTKIGVFSIPDAIYTSYGGLIPALAVLIITGG